MGSQLLDDRWRRGISGNPAVGGQRVSEEVSTVRYVKDAIDNVLSTIDALVEVLRLQKQTMLVVRLTAIVECSRGLVCLADHALRYSLTPHIDITKLDIKNQRSP